MPADPLDDLRGRLPRHAALLDALRDVVAADDRWRWLIYGCSLGAGGGDELSDIDAAIGYTGITGDDLFESARRFALDAGEPTDFVVHRMSGFPDDSCRIAAEYSDGVQLDLVLVPDDYYPGLPDRSVAVLDKDGALATGWVSNASQPPTPERCREWVVLGWWALSNVAKYLHRGSPFEAESALAEARQLALQLWAAGHGVPYAHFGLTSLLDFPPFELPDGLAATYAVPDNPQAVRAAAHVTADLLESALAAVTVDADLDSPLGPVVRRRLE
jgi:hypothetical protein